MLKLSRFFLSAVAFCIFSINIWAAKLPELPTPPQGILPGARVLSEPPEKKVTSPKRDLPENIMTRQIEARRIEEKAKPIKDAQGKTHYIVDLTEDAPQAYSDKNPPKDKFPDWHKPKMRHLLKALEQELGFEATTLTSWVANSFSAFLTEAQVEKLKKDKRVTRITRDGQIQLSGDPLWRDTWVGGDTFSWGANAVGGGKYSNGTVKVYILDLGVGYHVDCRMWKGSL